MTTPPWRSDPLGYLIGPTDGAAFLTDTFERERLVVRRGEPERYRDLLSIDGIDALLAGRLFRDGEVELVRADRRIARADFECDDGSIDRGAVARGYQQGATIILNQLHDADPTLAAFCRDVQQVFSAHVQTNVYLTPPGGQGFRTHYDSHDVFVLQVTGAKNWRLYDRPLGAPYRGERFAPGVHDETAPIETFTLEAGDCAYVPRGLMHDAETAGDGPSLHITVGIIVRTWADLVLEAVSEVALGEPAFRAALPPGFARPGADRAALRATFADLIRAVADKAEPDAALDLFADAFARHVSPDTRGAISLGVTAITDDDRFAMKPGVAARIAEDGDALALIAPGGDLSFPADHRAFLERVLERGPFTRRDGALPEDAAEAALRKLLAFGVIGPADDN